MFSPSPDRLLSCRHHLNSSISHRARIAYTFALALLSIAFGVSSVPAQSRARRARPEPQKSSKRDNDKKRVDDKKRTMLAVRDKKRADDSKRVENKRRDSVAASKRPAVTEKGLLTTEKKRTTTSENYIRDNSKQVAQNPLVRQTALTYSPKAPNQPASRPVLVNDITVVSRVSEKPSSSSLMTVAPRTGSASANIPSIWPVMGSLRSGVGVRGNPFGGPGTEYHKGQDIAAPMGTPVIATADGTIIIAGWQRGYGWVVYIDHGNGITTRYGHLSRIDVELGQTIRRGEQLGLVGSTGRSTGPHLHYEVRINGQPVSPLLYLPAQNALSSAVPQSTPTTSAQK
ncbi:MAG TPA: M23 family metallopeptidase [Pyrinomonadaceae bacterium]|nr:M23 family metallopeptidase [Pyrinomonadaceae bacterium]